MRIKIKLENAIGSLATWNDNELYINGESASAIFKKIGQMIADEKIEEPVVALTIIANVYNSKEMGVEINE